MRETWVIVVPSKLFPLSKYKLLSGMYEVLLNSPANMLRIIFISRLENKQHN